MAPNPRLRVSNTGPKPISTMHNNPSVRTQNTILVGDERPSKRQKQGGSTGAESRFFKPPMGGRDNCLDLTDSASHDPTPDRGDVWSISSAGKSTIAATALPEYRRATSQITFKPKKRPRRRSSRPHVETEQNTPNDLADRGPSPVITLLESLRAEASPGALFSPPPADIVSDIRPKRGRPIDLVDSARPAVKRPKKTPVPEEVSDDELCVQGPSPVQTNKRTTNFSQITGALKSQASRGDIQQTKFQSPQSPGKKPTPSTLPSAFREVKLTKAVGGKDTHPLKGEEDADITLKLGKVGAVYSIEDSTTDRSLSWVNINPKTIHTIEHAATTSHFMVINRTAATGVPALLMLQFKTVLDATAFFSWIAAFQNFRFLEVEPENLERKFNNVFSKTQNYVPRAALPSSSQETESSGLVRSNQPRFTVSNTRDPFRPPADDPSIESNNRTRISLDVLRPEAEGMETRRTRRTSPVRQYREPSPVPERWTVLNPMWDKDWHRSLVYPATGKNRTNVERDDIARLDEGEFLNDNLINFYSRYLQDVQAIHTHDISQNVYFFSTFFYAKLRSNRSKLNYDGVKSWTSKVDLLSYKYIVVPVNENAHWYLAIICNAPRTLPTEKEKESSVENSAEKENGSKRVESPGPRSSPNLSVVERDISFISLEDEPMKPRTRSDRTTDIPESSPSTIIANKSQDALVKNQDKKLATSTAQKTDVNAPRIITLDSLGSAHSPTCRYLREYLVEEAKDKKGVELSILPGGITAKHIPEQNNFCDCGVFILGYMEEFLKNPDEAVRRLLMREDLRWEIKPSVIRTKVRGILFELQAEQQKRLDEELKEKMAKKLRIQKQKERKAQAEQAAAGLDAPAADTPQRTLKKMPSTPREFREEQSTPRPQTAPETNSAEPSVEQEEKRADLSSPVSPLRSSPIKTTAATPVGSPSMNKTAATPSRHSKGVIGLLRASENTHAKKPDPSIDTFSPVRTSPAKRKPTVDLTAFEEVPSQSAGVPSVKKSDDGFVRALSVTSNEVTPSRVKVNDRRTTSPEVTIVKRTHREIRVSAPHIERDATVHVVPSIESDQTPSGAHYYGVDRSIDLTEAP